MAVFPHCSLMWPGPSDNLKPMPLVSISVNQTVPLRDALFELARQAGYDVEIDPNIRGSIIFTAHEKPFDTVVQRISEIAGLRYRFKDDIIRVELDTPYNHTYKVDYLNYIRKSKSSINNDIAVVSGDGTDTGSAFEATGESESDFWAELEGTLTQILGVAPGSGNLRTETDPQIQAVAQNPAPVAPVIVEGEGEEGAPAVQVQAPDAVLQVSTLPTDGEGGGNYAGTGESEEPAASFALNKQSGLISVFAPERQQKEVAEYLTQLKRSATAQVLIEAKVLEVSLLDEFATGIDWSQLSLTGKGALDLNFPTPGITSTLPTNTNISLAVGGADINALIQAVSRYGTVRALASPRLTVLNNQAAALNVAENVVYFEIDIETTVDEGVTNTTFESEIRNVPEGVLINVQPSIDLENRKIAMALRPTVTNIDSFETDPVVAIEAARAGLAPGTVESRIPRANGAGI